MNDSHPAYFGSLKCSKLLSSLSHSLSVSFDPDDLSWESRSDCRALASTSLSSRSGENLLLKSET